MSCPIGTLAPGATGAFTITVTIPIATATGTVITNGTYSIYASGVSALVGPKVLTTVTSGTSYANARITKTDGIAAIGWGQADTYTIVVSNAGPLATNATVTDTMPAQLAGVTWTCAAAGGGTCTASGSGNISQAVSLPVGATLTYTVNATIIAGSGTSSVVNTATVATTGGIVDPDSTNNTAVDTDTIGTLRTLTVTKLGVTSAGSIVTTPAAISCGTGCTSATADFLDGSQVQLTAAPITGATFVGWGGACSGTATTCTLTMTGAQSVTATFVGAAASTTVSGGGTQQTRVSTAFATPLAVRVADAANNPVPGATVTFAAPGSGASASLSATTAVTNASGIAQITATANATPGAYAVTASMTGITPAASFALTNVGAPASIVVSAGSGQSTAVGTAFGANLVALVRDAASQPISGITVTFAAPGSGARAVLGTTSATTDASGLATTAATAGTVAGSYSVSASTTGVAAPASFALTNAAGAAAALAITAGDPQSATVATSFAAPLVVRAADSYGNPVSGVVISFTPGGATASAAVSPASATTNASGLAQTAATANTVAGAYAVTASATGLASVDFALANTAGIATSVAITGGGAQTATVHTSFAQPLAVVVTDAYGNAVPGAVVTFSAPSSGASAGVSSATTNAAGAAATAAIANDIAGSYTVTASIAGGASVGFALVNAAGAPATVTFTGGGAQSATVGTTFAQSLTARVVDAYGNPVPGATVTFTAPASGAGLATSPITATTSLSGVAMIAVTANHTAGTYSVSAAVAGASPTPTISLTNTAGAATAIAVVSGDGQHAQVATAFASPLVVAVTDAYGNAVPSATVTFTAPGTGATAGFGPAIVTTAANGRASTTATAGSVTGAYSVTAAITGTTTTFGLTNDPGAPATIAVISGSGQSANVATAFAAALVAEVRDGYGNTVPGTTVTFAAPAAGARAVLASTSTTTDAVGRASTTATAGQTTGTYAVTATVTGTTPASFALTNTAGAVATLTATGGGGQSAIVLTAFALPLAVHAADSYGNAVPGATVTFAAPSATFPDGASATTDPSGNAQVAVAAGPVATSYTATASSGAAPAASFALTNLPGAAVAVTVVDGTPQQATVTQLFGAPLRVIVRDAQGNPVPGATVHFAPAVAPATATLSATSATTDSAGIASTTATASEIAGAYDVAASLPSIPSATFTLTNLADVPASITVAASASPQQMTVLQPFAMPLTVVVRDRFGNAAPGATVTFTVPAAEPSATLAAGSSPTDATGTASVVATAGARTGSYVVYAAVDGIAEPAAFSLTNTAGSPATLVIAGGDGQRTTVDTDFTSPLAVLVLDANNNPVPNAVVTFTAPFQPATATLAASSAQSDATGIATITAHASVVAGNYTVTAALTGASSPVSFLLSNAPGPAATITASPSSTPQNAQVDQAFATALVARVADAYDNGVPGVTVTYAAPATGATGALSAPTAVTGPDGRSSVALVAGTVAGGYVITATAPGVADPAEFSVANLPGTAQIITVASGSGQTATVAAPFAAPIVALVQDAYGNPVPAAVVDFAAPDHGATATLELTETFTAADGTAQTQLTAGTIAGEVAIIATTPQGATPAVFALVVAPGLPATATAIVAATPQSAEVLHAFGQPLAVAIADAYGNRVPGVPVDYAAPAQPGAVLSASSATTGADGVASVLAVADSIAGGYTVTATIEGTSDVAFALTNTASSPDSVLLTGGGAQHTLATTAFAQPVTARVVDAYGNAVPGVVVTFTVPATGATAALSDAMPVTGIDGAVSTTLTAGPIVGTFTLAAQAPGAFAAGTTTLEVLAIPTTTTATTGPQSPVDGAAQVTITVHAELGQPTGTVDIIGADGTHYGSATLEGGTATFDVTGLPLGTHAVTARYPAQGSYDTSESASVTFTVSRDSGTLSGGGCNAGGHDAGGLALVLAVLVLALPRRRGTAAAVAAAATVVAGLAGQAGAQPDGARALDRYHAASPDSAWFALDSAGFTGHREVALSFVGDYANQPLTVYAADGSVRERVVTDALIVQLGASLVVNDVLRLSATVPMAPWQAGPGGTFNGMALSSPEFAFGDVAVAGDVRVHGEPGGALRIATGVRVALPTGSRTNFMSDGVFGVEPRLLIGGTQGAFEYAGSASAFVRPRNEMAGAQFGSELRYSAAAGVRFADGRWLVGPELVGAAPLIARSDIGTPLEAELGAHYTATSHLRVGLGGAIGVVNAIGEPRWRMLASFAWNP